LVDQYFDVVVEVDEVEGFESIEVRVHSNACADTNIACFCRRNMFLVERAGEVVLKGPRFQVVGVAIGAVKDLFVRRDVDEDLGEVTGVRDSFSVLLQHVGDLH
jgi:hypothetical protein